MSYVGRTVRGVPRIPSGPEQAKILRVTGEHVDGFRDHMIISLALGSGLRENEIAGLNVGDVARSAAEIRGRIQLKEYKGRAKDKKAASTQYVFLSKAVRLKLLKFLAWKTQHGEVIGQEGPLFISRQGHRISTRTIRHMFHTWQRRAGIDRPYNFHSLRHACMTNLYAATKDLRVVQRQARHKSVNTSAIYAHVSDDTLRKAVEDLPS